MTVVDLLRIYEKSPKGFGNIFKFAKDDGKVKAYLDIMSPYFDKYGINNFSEIFYNIKYSKISNSCKICSQRTKFKSFKHGYKTYCSLECSRSDPTKTSPEMRKKATEKRMRKMQILLNDPIRGAQYRKQISEKSKIYNNKPGIKEIQSERLKNKIKNGNFTPNITNSWTHWETKIGETNFRSSYEGLFFLYMKVYKHKNVEYETLRIEYEFLNNKKIYIVDFKDDKTVYEIKPKNLVETDKNLAKIKALRNWCESNNMRCEIITENNLSLYLREMEEDKEFDHEFLRAFRKKYPKW
jgi:hypothetical protein